MSKSNLQRDNFQCRTISIDNLSDNSNISNSSNKTFLLKKLLQNTNEELPGFMEPTSKKPVPKPRKSKITAPEGEKCSSDDNSIISQRTYNVDNMHASENIIKSVSVTIHNKPISPCPSNLSKHNSSDLGRTYTKSISDISKPMEDINTISDLENSEFSREQNVNLKNEVEKSVVTPPSVDINEAYPQHQYSYNKIVEIVVHKTDALQLDTYVIHPTVKVHIVDINTGKYYPKSNKDRSVVFYYENQEQDYILPVMTGSYNLQEKRTFIPEWEESILLNEDFNYLANENVLIFFEVLDYAPFMSKKLEKYCCKGWHRINFAFLKPIGRSLNINKRVKLQLYYPKENKTQDPNGCDLWHLWKDKKLKKYPSALHVTVKEVASPKNVIETFRSKTPLQRENIHQKYHRVSSQKNKINTGKEILLATSSKDSKESLNATNKPVAELDSYENGCFLLKFSHNGLYLACAVQIKEVFTIITYEVESFEEIYSVNEHRGLIYCINWSSDDTLLLTASADNTVVIWNFATNSFFQILPHPIYVYANHIDCNKTIIATGCYDKTVRMWLFNNEEEKYELHQELDNHEGYVTSVCFNTKSTHLYSSDSTGHIIEWFRLDNSDWQLQRDISIPDLRHTVINEIVLFPNEKKMLVHSRDSMLKIISIKRGCVLHWLQGALNTRIQTFCSITSCGRYVTSGSENGLVVVWDAKTGKDVMTYEPFLNHCETETVHCARFHPKQNLIAFSHYGSGSPILLYEYNSSKREPRQTNDIQPLSQENHGNFNENGKSEMKENILFHKVLEKMDKLLS